MKIGVLGAGRMATAMAPFFARAGHETVLGFHQDEAALERIVAGLGSDAVRAGTLEDVVGSDLVVLAVGWAGAQAAVKAARSTGMLDGRPLWSIVNCLKPDMSGLEVGTTTSGSEQIAEWAGSARVVAGWPPFFTMLRAGYERSSVLEGREAFLCGSDAETKATVSSLLASMHLQPIDAGPLSAARLIEPAMLLLVHLAYVVGMGEVTFRLEPVAMRSEVP